MYCRFHLSVCDDEEAKRHVNKLRGYHVISLRESKQVLDCQNHVQTVERCPLAAYTSLSEIFKYNTVLSKLARGNPNNNFVIFTGPEPTMQVKLAFLVGCHLILEHGLGFEATYLALRPLHLLFDRNSVNQAMSVKAALRAFCCSKCLIDFKNTPD